MIEFKRPALPDTTRTRYDGSVSDGVDRRDPRTHRVWIGASILVAGLAVAGLGLTRLARDGSSPAPEVEVQLAELGDTPVELPLEETERVQYWVNRFATDQRSTFEHFLDREVIFGEMIREKLRNRGMPTELLYLAMIESGLRPSAVSGVAAVGVWQFMDPTARQYGLRIDEWVDERRDPIRATDAALDYLEWLHERYDSWYLAAAAYNAGPTRVDRALRRSGAEQGELDLFWEIQHMLPRETQEHVPRMIAATLLARRADDYGFVRPVGGDAFEYDMVWVPGGTPLAVVAEAVQVDRKTLRMLNPQLIRATTPPDPVYSLRVPVGSAPQVVASIGGGPWGTNLIDR